MPGDSPNGPGRTRPARTSWLTRYNRLFNDIVLRNYDDAQLSLPGLALGFEPYPHQVAAVARIISEPAVLLAHEVGAGKTAEMTMGAMELRRLELVNKPCIVGAQPHAGAVQPRVPPALPAGEILVMQREDLQGDRRRQFVARCATGDWDAVIMSRTGFERIPMSDAAQREYTQAELNRMRDFIQTSKEGDGLTVKRLEGALLRAEERLKAKLDSAKDPGVTFEATGIDYVFVDEAHGYKNLRTPSNIPDASIDGSQRASDLDMKISYLRNSNGKRVITFATATPIANSITEAYVMQHYLRPDLLDAAGMQDFDTWAATFAGTETEIEIAPEGGDNFRQKTRFRRFYNVPELLRRWHMSADIKTAEDLRLPVPSLAPRADRQRAPETVVVQPSEELVAFMHELAGRADDIRNRRVHPKEDNMLKVSGDGRAAALDMRLALDEDLWAAMDQDLVLATEVGMVLEIPGKIGVAAERIHAIWDAHRDDAYPAPGDSESPVRGSLQLVFCDIGTPSDRWNVYEELRDQLTARGMPPAVIRFVHDAKTDRDKGELFAACRAGGVAVLLGSTEKMGVGTNVQDRAIALHHLDCPWRPADVAQREGRILRPGNLNRKMQRDIHIIRYVTERSFDAYMWQTVERKAKFIAQVMRGRLDVREMEDIGDAALSYSEVKALATGNPLLLEKAEADAELTRLERAEHAWHRNQDALRHRVTHAEQRIGTLTALVQDIGTATGRRRDTRGDAFAMTASGFTYAKRADAGRRLQQLIAQMHDGLLKSEHRRLSEQPGELGGFPVTVTVERVLGSMNVILALDGAPGTDIRMSPDEVKATDPAKLVIRLENRLSGMESLKTRTLADIDQLTAEAAHGRDDLARPFTQAELLDAARDRAARLNQQLGQAAAPKQDAALQPVTGEDDDWLVKAAMHDAAVMAGIPGSSVMVISHYDSEPGSAVQASRHDFPSGNPLAGASDAADPPPPPRPSRPPGPSARPRP